jgi:hypothetical protein
MVDALIARRATGPVSKTPRTLSDVLPGVVATAVCLLPFLVPAGPGNSSLPDLAIATAIGVAMVSAAHARVAIHLPYAVGTTCLLVGGLLGSLVAGAGVTTVLVLAQDVFLLLWAATLALGRSDPAIIVSALTAWCRFAPVYATVMVIAYVLGFNALAGVTENDGVRASYTFGDPNLAANYLVLSLFVMIACRRPVAPGVRWIAYGVVLLALAFTGSNGALLSLLLGLGLLATLSRLRSQGLLAGALAGSASLLIVAGSMLFVQPHVHVDAARQAIAGSIPLLRDSLGRSNGSADERKVLLEEGYQLYLGGTAFGVGPARTRTVLRDNLAPYVKEAHNDYLATLVERGVVGCFGLIALIVAIGVRCHALFVRRLPTVVAEAVPRAWALVVVAPVMALSGTFYEVLHFRHFWTWLGLLAALALVGQREPHVRRPRESGQHDPERPVPELSAPKLSARELLGREWGHP